MVKSLLDPLEAEEANPVGFETYRVFAVLQQEWWQVQPEKMIRCRQFSANVNLVTLDAGV